MHPTFYAKAAEAEVAELKAPTSQASRPALTPSAPRRPTATTAIR